MSEVTEKLGCGCLLVLVAERLAFEEMGLPVWVPCHRHWHVLLSLKDRLMTIRPPDSAALHG